MRFIECQSLKHLTLVKIATLLWKQNHVDNIFRQKTRCVPQYIIDEDIGFMEACIVLENVRKLSLPKKLENEVSCYIRPIGDEIIYWKEFECFIESDVIRKLCWTPQGTIDNRKTAEAFVKDQDFNVPSRYILACNYCLESDIRALWDQMPESARFGVQIYIDCPQNEIVQFWCSVMEGNDYESYIRIYYQAEVTLNQYLFEYAAKNGYKGAVEYFFKKLTAQEKCQCLVKTAKHVAENIWNLKIRFKIINRYSVDILCFLLSQIDREQQINVIAENAYAVLCSFLEWPWQNLFVDAANLTLDKLSVSRFHRLLNRIVDKISDGYKDSNYTELFGEIWRQSLSTHKRFIIDLKWDYVSVLPKLLKNKDKINLKRILKDATSEEKKKLISYHSDNCVCHYVFNKEIWDAIKLFVSECISNANEMGKFKNDVKNGVSNLNVCLSEAKEKTLNAFFEFIDHFHNAKKRSVEDDDDIYSSKCKVSRK